MFETWLDFKGIFGRNDRDDNSCDGCGTEDFDLLCKEKEDDGQSKAAIFICKNCGQQKRIAYSEIEEPAIKINTE
ncbi:hypothetical protein [Planococcus sp. CAU13]|uniref:hypothetical protein n=1 Tax=Planococcus sp. CAU13 TaxID=1541197 RepID=UPI00052FEC20|nr:hypothetical protein [Planococcus sp. CAU13]